MNRPAVAEDFEFSLDPIAFEEHPQESKQPRARSSAPRRSALSLSLLLRVIGGMVIVAAFLMYLFQGWREGDDLSRSLMLLGHTALLALAGFASGHLLHESKGARLFIALALAAVPVNVAFLGGLSYGHLSWDGAAAIEVAESVWTSSAGSLSSGSALLLAAASLAGLSLVIWVGFLIMARRSVWALSGLYLLTNAALLLPTRHEAVISSLLLALGLGVSLLSWQVRRRDPSLSTPEGVFARAVLFAPLLVLGGRTLWLYSPDTLFFTTLSVISYLGLRLAVASSDGRGLGHGVLAMLAMLVAMFTSVLALGVALDLHLPDMAAAPLGAGIFAVLLVDLSRADQGWRMIYRRLAILIITLSMTLNLLVFASFTHALLNLALGLATLVYGYSARARGVFTLGLITASIGLGYAGNEALSGFSLGGWSALVLLGVLTVIAGSLIERYGARLKAARAHWHQHFAPLD